MKKYIFIGIIVLVIAGGAFIFWGKQMKGRTDSSMQPPAESDSSSGEAQPNQNLVIGTFSGTFACADCSGLLTELTLTRNAPYSGDGTYKLAQTYQGKSGPMTTTGKWGTLRGDKTDINATVYQLDPDKPNQSQYYLKASETQLKQLDSNLAEINSPFNTTLTLVGSEQSSGSSTVPVSPIFAKLPSWLAAKWSNPTAATENAGGTQVSGQQSTATVTSGSAQVQPFEDKAYLQSLGFTPDIMLSAGGPGGSSWGYKNTSGGKTQYALFSYRTQPSSNNPNEPVQFNCPCSVTVSAFVSSGN